MPMPRKRVTVACARCGKVFERRKSETINHRTGQPVRQFFCNRACDAAFRAATRVRRICLGCGKEYETHGSQVRHRGSNYCSKECQITATTRIVNGRVLTLEQRFENYINRAESGCWEWTGPITPTGYGKFTWRHDNRRTFNAHRVSYELYIGPIPDGMTLDHLCRNRRCVNPAHLEPVTGAENTRRGIRRLQTHCPQGHPYDDSNTYWTPQGYRKCKACRRERNRKHRLGPDPAPGNAEGTAQVPAVSAAQALAGGPVHTRLPVGR